MLIRCLIPLASFELDIDASFEAKVSAIFGPSGSGKTTLIDAIAGLRKITAGEIEINGKTLFSSARGINVSPQARSIGYLPQEKSLFPHLSVKQNMLFGARRSKEPGISAAITMDHVCEVLEIGHLLHRPVTKLSGGEAQRVALARAILSGPQLLLLDEPLAAVDLGLKEKILPYLARVRDEFAIPMIYVTHNVTEVLTLADWVLMIKHGRLVAQGVPREALRSTPAVAEAPEEPLENVFAVTFIESDLQAGQSKVRLESGQELFVPYLPRPANEVLQISISGEDILIGTKRPEGISAGNIVPGRISRIAILRGQAIITVSAGAEFYVRLTASAVARLQLVEQLPVYLIMKTRSFRLL